MIQPFGNNMVVKMNIQEKIGGIVIPTKSQQSKSVNVEMQVVVVGPDVKINVKVGDLVVCQLMYWVSMDGFIGVEKGYGIIKEEYVLGVIR